MTYESVYSGAEESPMHIMQAFLKRFRLPNSEGTYLDLNKINIHKLFYDYQVKNNFLFKKIYFNGNPKSPFSQQIEDVFYEMTVCGKLTRPNPTMVKYNFVAIDETSYDQLPSKLQEAIDALVTRAQNMSAQ